MNRRGHASRPSYALPPSVSAEMHITPSARAPLGDTACDSWLTNLLFSTMQRVETWMSGKFNSPKAKKRSGFLMIEPQRLMMDSRHPGAVTARDIELSFPAPKGKLDAPCRAIPKP